ncbi:hypothetical protein [Paenibacillus xylanexedens]
MLRPWLSLARDLTDSFVDALLHTYLAMCKRPGYKGGLAPPLIGLSPTR